MITRRFFAWMMAVWASAPSISALPAALPATNDWMSMKDCPDDIVVMTKFKCRYDNKEIVAKGCFNTNNYSWMIEKKHFRPDAFDYRELFDMDDVGMVPCGFMEPISWKPVELG